MLKTIKIGHVFICTLTAIISGACYAETYSHVFKMPCAPSLEQAGWEQINGKPNAQYSVTLPGIEVKGEGLVTQWADDENFIYHDGANPHVSAKCISGSGEVSKEIRNLFSDENIKPTFSCPKGDSIQMRFLAPRDPDPTRYVAPIKLTVTRDDPENQVKKADTQVEQGIKNKQAHIAFTQAGSGSLSGSGW